MSYPSRTNSSPFPPGPYSSSGLVARNLLQNPHAHMSIPKRRNAVDYGTPQDRQERMRAQRPVTQPTIVHRLPPPVHASRLAPPCQDVLHPYNFQRILAENSGNYVSPRRPQSNCAECKADYCIQVARSNHANPIVVIPDEFYKGPGPGEPTLIQFYPPSRENSRDGVWLPDILTFRNCIVQPGFKLLAHQPGPLKVALYIDGYPKFKKVHDILFANCEHRAITRFNLAWWLATHFRIMVEHGLQESIDDLQLVSLYSPDSIQWTATARFVHRI
ncbi:hypothetical protein C8R44DRAFT_865647 [Mycena epipterygia]|nr:hypothetical protein C8R44DRAFT_865647 [Mycena epipterygia]